MLKNLDNKTDVKQEFYNAIKEGDQEKIQEAFINFVGEIENNVLERAQNVVNVMDDRRVLENRGTMMPLTSEERKFFNAVIEKQTFEGIEEMFPKTILSTIFDNIKQKHPLLSRIDARNTNGVLKMLFAMGNEAVAFWGPICDDIRQMILKGFKEVDISASKLSGFVPLCKPLLKLGPNWLAEYVIQVMTEAMSIALEIAVVTGDGENKPIGMMKALTGAVDGVYKDKEAVAITDLQLETLADIRADIARKKMDSAGMIMMVNPATYWDKVVKNLAFRTLDGTWIRDRLATGEEIVQSYAVPEDKIILGNPKQYLLGVAAVTEIVKYDQTLAIEDHDLYIAKFLGMGLPKHEDAFTVLDLTNFGAGAGGGGGKSKAAKAETEGK